MMYVALFYVAVVCLLTRWCCVVIGLFFRCLSLGLALLSHYCHNIVELWSLCYRFVSLLSRYRGALIALFLPFCRAVIALLFHCCRVVIMLLSFCFCTVVALLFVFVLFNSCSSLFSSLFRCQRVMTLAVFSLYNEFQLELKSYFQTWCKVFLLWSGLPHLFCKGLSTLLFFYPGYYVMLFIGQIFGINLVSIFEYLPLIFKSCVTASS